MRRIASASSLAIEMNLIFLHAAASSEGRMELVTTTSLSGDASMQMGNGAPLTYKVDGSVEGGVYTIKISDRTDGKKNCVWTGHAPTGAGAQSSGLLGYVECEGAKLIIRASIVQ